MDPKTNNDRYARNAQAGRDAAADVVRGQIDSLYSGDPRVTTPTASTSPQQTANAYKSRTSDLNEYHKQWQNYYQKYYEQYYVGKVSEAVEEHKRTVQPKNDAQQEELHNLREKIIDTAKGKAKKARKSRHFIPIFSGVAVMLIVAFLQYNQLIFARVEAYISPGNIDPQNIILDPTNLKVDPAPKLIIPKINVDVPVIYGVGNDYKSLMSAMSKGVAHFSIPGASSVPGELGNVVLSGHSSNDLFDTGDYKFIFAQLEKMKKGDNFYINFNSTRYTYVIVTKKVVQPTDVKALLGYDNKPYVTLITCTPLGTALNRLLVIAEQVSPDPSKAKAPADANTATDGNVEMPGNSPTVLERLFGR